MLKHNLLQQGLPEYILTFSSCEGLLFYKVVNSYHDQPTQSSFSVLTIKL